MLPTGHIAAGYLTSLAVIKIVKPDLDLAHINYLIALGTFFAFAPDLDSFYVFLKLKSWTFKKEELSHRELASHAPVLWLIAGLVVFFLAPTPFWKLAGLLLWLGSWSHFAIDTIQHGIMWFWPLKTEIYALKDRGKLPQNTERGFFKYWFHFLGDYWLNFKITFCLEVFLIVAAVVKFLIR